MRRRRWGGGVLRAAGWGLAGLLALALVVAFGAPLIARGPILARLADYGSRSICGRLIVRGGHVSPTLAPALLLQRPFDVALDRVRILEPEGYELFHAVKVRAVVTVRWRPFHVVVDRLFVSDGRWRLANKGLGRPITEAFRKVPPGGRDQCTQPVPPEEARPPAPGPRLVVKETVIERVTVILSFPAWAVTLHEVDAHGTVEVRGAPSGTQILFDGRDIRAPRGGALRVGPRGGSLTPVIPFDEVTIPRVVVRPEDPQNLWLELKEARTARAVLSGRAEFTDVFVPRRERRVPAGMEMEARWRSVGQALERTPSLAAVGARLAALGVGLRASLHGPFPALTGSAELAGQGVSARARLLADRRYGLELRFDALDITRLLPRARRPLLGGTLDGRLALSARLGPGTAARALSLDAIDLSLARAQAEGPDRWPARWVVTRDARPRAADELRVTLGPVALRGDHFVFGPFRLDAPGILVEGRATGEGGAPGPSGVLALSRLRWDGRELGAGRLTFRGIPDGTELEGAPIPGVHIQGRVHGGGRAGDFLGARLALARIPASLLSLSPLHLRRAAGVLAAEARLGRGRGALARRIEGSLEIVERLTLWPVGLRAAVVVPPARIELRGDQLRVPGLIAQTSGARATLAGVVDVDRDDLRASALALSLAGAVDGRKIGPWLPARGGGGSGSVAFDGQIAGSIAEPRLRGRAQFQNLEFGWPGLPVEAVTVRGPVTVNGRALSVGPLVARFQSGGWVEVAGPQGAGRVVLGPRGARGASLPVSDVDLTLRGSGLTTTRPIGGFTVRGLALGVRVTETGQDTLRVDGQVYLGHGFFRPGGRPEGKAAGKGSGPRRGGEPGLADRVWLHLRLVGPDDAVRVAVPGPDVTLGARCLVEGPLSAPRVTGKVEGKGIYSKAALALADWFTPRNLRACDLGPK